jgi:hypothetical protein
MTELPERSNMVVELNGLQLSLHTAFLRKSLRIAAWYIAALQALNNPNNPDRYAQAAHSLREIMEKFPECAGRTVIDVAGNAANVLREIKQEFAVLSEKSKAAHDGFSGEIDEQLQSALVKIQNRVNEFEKAGNQRTEQTRAAFRELVPGMMPPVHERENLKAWNELRSYFVNIAHHKYAGEVSDEAFRAKLLSFEQMAGSQLSPAPTDDMALLDQLIKEAEIGHNS